VPGRERQIDQVREHAKQPRQPEQPSLVAFEDAPMRFVRQRMPGGNAQFSPFQRGMDAEPSTVPIVEAPVDQGKEQKREPPQADAVADHQADAEFTSLIVEKKKIRGDENDDERKRHRAERLQ
jgi:hypothetical protein